MSTSNSEWQRVVQQMKMNQNKQKKEWFYRFQNQTKCQSSSWIILFNFSCNITAIHSEI